MANHLNRVAVLLAAGIACAGCVAIWQSDHRVTSSSEWAVSVDYDPLLTGPDNIARAADTECSKFQRRAILEQVRQGRTWTKIAHFRCENEVPTKGGISAKANSIESGSVASYKSLPPALPTESKHITNTQVSQSKEGPQGEQSTLDLSQIPNVRYIDATGPNSGVIHRQIAKSKIDQGQTPKTKQTRIAGRSIAPTAINAPKLTAPILKRSLLS